ncbi:MAG: hypothetical protein QOC95_1014 [Thermoleophilaceae bacterium]|jgi:hypothetical protein|nr:hypothetical protein [Thermoleophilaceae bacterium]
MHPFLQAQLAALHQADLRRDAQARRARAGAAPGSDGVPPEVVIRTATPADGPSLAALSALDGAAAPIGPALVAEVAGAPRAVLPLDGSRPFGDPFRPTEELVALLELRAAQLRRSGQEHQRDHGRLGWMAPAALRRLV